MLPLFLKSVWVLCLIFFLKEGGGEMIHSLINEE
jgi:hypothetical protein